MKQNSPLLSIGMIVKNEIRCIEKCLKALQPLRDSIPCELVIADTGSTDGTRELVMQYADIFFDFKWINDFSAARNAILDRCSGFWFLSVDADEYLQPNVDELVDFLHSEKSQTTDFCTVIIRNHLVASMDGEYADFPAPRLAKRTSDLFYHGSIHESFSLRVHSVIDSMDQIIFDHDGYADLSPEHFKNKAIRNMTLLEEELEKDPCSLRRLLQCLESCFSLPEKKFKYTYLSMNFIMNEAERDEEWRLKAPVIARKAIECAVADALPEAEDWVAWARNTFPDSLYVQVDINFSYLHKLHNEHRYDDEVKIGQEYLAGVQRYRKVGPSIPELRASSIFGAHKNREHHARTMIAYALRELKRDQAVIDMIEKIDLSPNDLNLMIKWLALIEGISSNHYAAKTVAKKLGSLLAPDEKLSRAELTQADTLMRRIRFTFSNTEETKPWYVYREMPGDVGICAKLASAEDKGTAEKLLGNIQCWENLMPASLYRAIALGAHIPDKLFSLTPERLHELIAILPQFGPDCFTFIDHYTDPKEINRLDRLCFAFDLLATFCMSKTAFSNENCDLIAAQFANICSAYLQMLYNAELLQNEFAIARLPALHRFAWYYVTATEQLDDGNKTGYIHTLRTALMQCEAMKPLVQYLLDHIKAQQEQERAERIASASPELIALAEQVKTILATYPADDPAVVQIKQSPAYQQVAFLIEEPDELAQ